MVVSAHQPAYIPWLGYFEKIKRSDLFIFLDTVQFEKNSFTNRNKIKTSNGPIWLTVPVIKKNHFEKKMNEMLIDNTIHWRKKHLNAIGLAYKKARYFDEFYPKLEKLYEKDYYTLVDVTIEHLKFWLNILDIDTKISYSSELVVTGKKSDLVLDICKSTHADKYLSGTFGKDYLNLKSFEDNGIEVEFQDYVHPVYEQLYGEFVPNMGIVDLVMNTKDYDIIWDR